MTDSPGWTAPAFLDSLLPDLRLQMLRMYCDGLRDQSDRLAAMLVDGGSLQAATTMVHKIAGAAGMMQDAPLAQAARHLENRLREAAPDAHMLAQDLLERVQRTLVSIDDAIG